MREPLLRVALLLLLLQPAHTQRPPNIVLYLMDDVGVGMINQHAPKWSFADDEEILDRIPESRKIQTPTLERMAREGKRMLRSYASSSVCGPSRHSLMTGIQTGASDRIRGNGFGDDDTSDVDIESGRTTIANVLKTKSYRTGAFGKWGMASGTRSSGSPCRNGFDRFYGKFTHRSMGSGFPTEMYSCSGSNPANVRTHSYSQNREASRSRCVAADGEGESASPCLHFDRLVREQALDFVEEQRNDHRPFFLYWATTAGHVALYGEEDKFANCELKTHPVPSFGRYTSAALRGTGHDTESIRGVMAMVEYTVDEDMRLLLNTLQHSDPDNNTLIIVASDNGPHQEAFEDAQYDPHRDLRATAGLEGIKRRTAEGGLRSPTLVWWPKQVPAGTVSHYPFMLYDLPLTIAEAAGVSGNARALAPLQTSNAGGVPLLPLLTAATDAESGVSNATRPWTYAEICFQRAGTTRPGVVCPVHWVSEIGCVYALYDLSEWPRSVHKLTQNFPQGPIALYDVLGDPLEKENLLRSRSETTTRLETLRSSLRKPLCEVEAGYDRECHKEPCAVHGNAKRDCTRDLFCRRHQRQCVTATCADLGRKPWHCRKRDDCMWTRWMRPRNRRCSDRPEPEKATSPSSGVRAAQLFPEWNGAVPPLPTPMLSLADAFKANCERETKSSDCTRNADCAWDDEGNACRQRECGEHGYRKLVCKTRPDCKWNWRKRPRSERCSAHDS